MKKVLFTLLIAVFALTAASHAGSLSVGTWGGIATLGYDINDTVSGSVGSFFTNSTTSTYGLLLKADYDLAKLGEVQTEIGMFYYTTSAGAWGQLGLTYGVETMVQDNLSLGADFIVVDSTSYASGATSLTRVLPAVAITAALFI
ncbi:MAG: hypothetical protein ABIH69_03515 [bacterium]|nr:hypothetical protein [Candidatus Margulisiibacteriota bacterium]